MRVFHSPLVFCLTAVLTVTAIGAEQTFSISPDPAGGDVLVRARNAIRAARRDGSLKPNIPVTVYLEPGQYKLTSTFELTVEDSGSPEAPVIYRARKPGTVRLQGGTSLPSAGFKRMVDSAVLARLAPQARDRVFGCDLSAVVGGNFPPLKTSFRGAPSAPWLYFNGHPMTLARWPNADAPGGGWAEFSKAVDTGLPQANADDPKLRELHPGAFVFEDSRPSRWRIEDGVWLLGYWTHDWSDEVLRIGSYDREKQVIRLAAPHNYGIAAGTWGASKRRFFAMNLLEELDAPGEWYLDREKKHLYFYPPAAALEQSEVVLATLTEPMLRVNGGKFIQFIDLALEYSHENGLVLQNSEGIVVAGCRIANLAGTGISVDGRNTEIRSCDLYHLGRGGINLDGGDRKTLTLANNVAVNNHIHHYGLFQRTYAPGIGVNGCGQIARNNRIHDAPHNAILYGGNEHLFEYNEIYRVVMETGDAGAFYTGRDWTSQGNVLRRNYVHDLGSGDAGHVNTMGVYLDDCDNGDVVEHNIFYRAGRAIMIGGGRDNTISGNLVVDCPIGLHLDARGMTWKQWNSPADPSWHLEAKAQRLNYTQPPWSERYPKLARIMQENPQQPLGNVIRENVFIDCTRRVADFDGDVRKLIDKLDISGNLAINTTGATNVLTARDLKGFRNLVGSSSAPLFLGFKDRAAGDFTLTPNESTKSAPSSNRVPSDRASGGKSVLLKEMPSFQAIDMNRIGLLKDQYRRELPPK